MFTNVPKNESGNPAKRAAAAVQHQPTYRHGEAFCLMTYRADDRHLEEVIWNSRDGVTPFVVNMKDGSPGTHVDWRNDRCVPDHKPAVGDRIFVDLTEQRAHEIAAQQARRIWDAPVDADLSYDPKGVYGRVERLADRILEGLLAEVDRGGPDVIEVTDELARQRGWLTGV